MEHEAVIKIVNQWDDLDYPDRVQLLLTAGMTLCDIRRGAAVTANWRFVNPVVKRRIALRIENVVGE
ncbi:MAG: hypothetical protein V1899_02775 [Planctomycetota bacterium]